MSDDIHLLSLVELADAIAARELSAVEVMTATVARAERLQPVLNCFISLQAEAALESAAAADAALARGAGPGPLHGVPLAHKDMFYREGHVTTCGSRIRRDFVPDHDSTALARLHRAGAIYLGGLNMAEFATGPTGHNEHWGDCRNPWNQAHISGGSSSGSGASIGGRVVYGALGSDTGGSVRLPSTCCGTVGLKPTNGLVSRHGIMPLSHTLDTVGPLTRTVRDAARIMSVIAGHDPRDPTTSDRPVPDYEAALAEGADGLKIGVPTDYFYDLATEEVRSLMERSLDVFRAAGAEVVEVAVPDIARINNLSNVVLSSEAAAIHEPWIAGRPGDYQEQVRNRYEPGLHVPAVKYIPGPRRPRRAAAGIRRYRAGRRRRTAHTGHPLPHPDAGRNQRRRRRAHGRNGGRPELVHPRRQLPRRPRSDRALWIHRERPAHRLPAHGPPGSRRRRSSASATLTSKRPTGTPGPRAYNPARAPRRAGAAGQSPKTRAMEA